MTTNVAGNDNLARRSFLANAAAALAGSALLPRAARSQQAPASPVALARCTAYGAGVLPALRKMFDQIGGIGSLVKGKTVAVKANMTGNPDIRAGFIPIERMTFTHPDVLGATVHLLSLAGASRIRILESPWKSAEPLEEYMISAGWEPNDFIRASTGAKVEFENTNFLGRGKQYHRFTVPRGGHLFAAYDLNHSYYDCDVFVSVGKMKEHATAGITLAIKNCFGTIPCTIYGDGAPEDEPGLVPRGGRNPIHVGNRQPPKSSLPEKAPTSPRDGGYRIPRCIADIVAMRPVDLAIIDGIESMNNGENGGRPENYVKPHLLVAGRNPVCVDAVGAAVMGFDPMADRGRAPFERADSTLRLAEELGVGTRDLKRIEVAGARISEVVFDFRMSRPTADGKPGGWPDRGSGQRGGRAPGQAAPGRGTGRG
jgi:uncharacterized protein (DUF362 family)